MLEKLEKADIDGEVVINIQSGQIIFLRTFSGKEFDFSMLPEEMHEDAINAISFIEHNF